jgi:hypothetical protein
LGKYSKMKDKTLKPVIKSAKKTARTAIQLRIISELKTIAKEFGQDSEDLLHEIEKGAKKLAKKISGQLKITTPADKAAPKETKAVKAAAKPKPAPKVKAAVKPTPVVSEKKAAVPAKAVNGEAKKVVAKAAPAKPVKKEAPAKTKAKGPTKKS